MSRSTAPYTLIEAGVAIGGLLAYGEELDQFDFKMNVAWELSPDEESILDKSRFKPISKYHSVVHARLNDDYIEPQIPEVLRAVGLVIEALKGGKTVLVTCAAGRNRSGLVLAESLITLGADVEATISNIQAKRLHALSNPSFNDWLRRAR